MQKYLIGIIIIFATFLQAQEVRVQASVQSTTVSLNQHFSYTVEVSGNATGLPSPEMPEFKNFNVLSAPSTSTNMQWVNGKMSASTSTTIFLQAKKEGQFKLPVAKVTYKGKTYTSNSINIKVIKSASTSPAGKQTNDPAISGQDLFIKTLVSNRNPYVGEQIIVQYKLYFRSSVRGYDYKKRAVFPGFWKEDFEATRQPIIESETVNGIQYNTAILQKIALFPTQTGELELDPSELVLEVQVKQKRNRRSLFDSFFDDPFGRSVQKTISTKPVKINVKPLPEKGKPDNFSGAVGNFNFRVWVDKKTVETNEAIALKMQLKGAGNIKVAEMPNVSIPVDIEQYEPKVRSSISKENGTISGVKSSETILIPRIAGDYKIKPVAFSFFNPFSKKYETILTKPIELTIKQGKSGPAVSSSKASGLSQQEVALLGRDIRYIKEFTSFSEIGYKSYKAPIYWFSVLGLLIIFMAFIIWDDRQARISGDERLVRNKRAGKLAAKQLTIAKSYLKTENNAAFFKALSQALQGFVRDKLNIELTEFSSVNIHKMLGEKGIPNDEIKEYQDVLQESDFKQFAGTGSSQEDCQQMFDRAKNILTRLEKWI